VLDADRLPRARGAQDHRDLALGQAHVQAAEDLVAAEGLVDVDELDGVRDARRAVDPRVPLVLVVGVRGLGLIDDGRRRAGRLGDLGRGLARRLRDRLGQVAP
jgi:hypothetical protein